MFRETFANQISHESQNYSEIKAWVLFNSKWDKNIPKDTSFKDRFLDWTGARDTFQSLKHQSVHQTELVEYGKSTNSLAKYHSMGMPDKPIRGVHYKKGIDWFGSHYTLTRPLLESDFQMMKQAGINTLQFQGPSVYDHNLLRISGKQGLQVIYSFWVPETLDFFRDKESLNALEKSILKTVERYKEEKHILAWNLGNPVWNELKNIHLST